MIITWNMQTFLNEGSFPTEQRMSFSKTPLTEIHEKNKYTTIACVLKSPVLILHTWCGVYLFNVSLWIKSYSVPLISIYDCIHKNQAPYLPQIYQNSE